MRRQCALLGVARSGLYSQPVGRSAEDLALMRWLDEQYTATPFYGIRRMTAWLRSRGSVVHHQHGGRLLRAMGLQALSPRPRLTQPAEGHTIYPDLLRGITVSRSHQVWRTGSTYSRLQSGFVSLVAVLDWFSRSVLSWALSITMDVTFGLEALEQAFRWGQPEIFNTEQGAQFTSREFSARLQQRGVPIRMDGRGRALDNVFVERLGRTVKYEAVDVRDDQSVRDARQQLAP